MVGGGSGSGPGSPLICAAAALVMPASAARKAPKGGTPGAACTDKVAKATKPNAAKITRNSASNKRVYEANLGRGAAVARLLGRSHSDVSAQLAQSPNDCASALILEASWREC